MHKDSQNCELRNSTTRLVRLVYSHVLSFNFERDIGRRLKLFWQQEAFLWTEECRREDISSWISYNWCSVAQHTAMWHKISCDRDLTQRTLGHDRYSYSEPRKLPERLLRPEPRTDKRWRTWLEIRAKWASTTSFRSVTQNCTARVHRSASDDIVNCITEGENNTVIYNLYIFLSECAQRVVNFLKFRIKGLFFILKVYKFLTYSSYITLKDYIYNFRKRHTLRLIR